MRPLSYYAANCTLPTCGLTQADLDRVGSRIGRMAENSSGSTKGTLGRAGMYPGTQTSMTILAESYLDPDQSPWQHLTGTEGTG